MKVKLLSFVFGLLLLGGVSTTSFADSMAIIFKGGSFKLSDKTQTVLNPNNFSNVTLTFDDDASGVFGGELEFRKDDGLAFGIEVFHFKNDWVSDISTSGDNDTFAIMGNIKKYFNPSGILKPYLGAGVGISAVDFSGPVLSAAASGLAIQAMAGIEIGGPSVAFYSEFKRFASEAEDIEGEDLDVSGTGVFAGIKIQF